MNDTSKNEDSSSSGRQVRLLSDELEEAVNRFLSQMEELEKQLSMVDE